mgnify:CR=1 FL=1
MIQIHCYTAPCYFTVLADVLNGNPNDTAVQLQNGVSQWGTVSHQTWFNCTYSAVRICVLILIAVYRCV